MLTVNEVAERLKLSKQCVYALIDSGNLPAHRFGVGRGTLRVTVDDLRIFLAKSRLNKATVPRKAPHPRLKHINLRPSSPGRAGV